MAPIYSSTAQCIILEDIDEDTGHTLVHYLCTGEYEEHCKRCNGPEQYRRSVLAYVAASNLSLGELESLASEQMEQYERVVDIFQILAVAPEIWPMVLADEDYVDADHLVDKVTAALECDLDLYDRDGFVHFGQSLEFDNFLL